MCFLSLWHFGKFWFVTTLTAVLRIIMMTGGPGNTSIPIRFYYRIRELNFSIRSPWWWHAKSGICWGMHDWYNQDSRWKPGAWVMVQAMLKFLEQVRWVADRVKHIHIFVNVVALELFIALEAQDMRIACGGWDSIVRAWGQWWIALILLLDGWLQQFWMFDRIGGVI
jgi:hypothetical protein